MTKIPLIIYNYVILPVSFHSPALRKGIQTLHFIVDTGSPETLISYLDAVRLSIPKKLLKPRGHLRIGGLVHEKRVFTKKSSIYAKTDEQKTISFDFKNYGVAYPPSKESKYIRDAQGMPSILGMDFLRKNKLKLACDPANSVAYLEA